jgi:hypothetical protein
MMCYYLMSTDAIDSVLLNVQGFDLKDAEASVEPPLDSGLSQGVCFWVICLL